jgi:hypothetical protein
MTELIIAGILTGFALALPLGPGAFAVIKTAMTTENGWRKKTATVVMAPILADLLWVSLALHVSVFISAAEHTNDFLSRWVGAFLVLIAIIIVNFGNKEKVVTFWPTLFAVIVNGTIAASSSFVISRILGPQYAQMDVWNKILLQIIIFSSDVLFWSIIICIARKGRRVSVAFLSLVYGIIIGCSGVFLFFKQFF